MELSSPKIEKFLTFSQKKFFLHFRKWKFLALRLKTFIYFPKKSFPYIFGNGTV